MDATIEQRLYEKAGKMHTPINAVFELLPLCNMSCDMCYVRLSKDEMKAIGALQSVDKWLKLAEQMQKAGTLFIMLSGGEPLLYPEFKRLYVELKKMGFVVTVNTNGTLIDEKWAKFFAKYPPRRMNVTLYGADQSTYKKLCHFEEGYEKAVQGIRLLRENNIDVKINGSYVVDNRDDIQKIIAFAKEVGAFVNIDTYMYPAVREQNRAYKQEVRVSPYQAACGRIEYLKAVNDEETYKEILREFVRITKETTNATVTESKINCQASKTSFAIDWQGYMRPCVMLKTPLFPVFEMDFMEAWDKLKEELEKMCVNDKCAQCKYRRVCIVCPAKVYWETKSMNKTPEYVCAYTKELVRRMEEEWENVNG